MIIVVLTCSRLEFQNVLEVKFGAMQRKVLLLIAQQLENGILMEQYSVIIQIFKDITQENSDIMIFILL